MRKRVVASSRAAAAISIAAMVCACAPADDSASTQDGGRLTLVEEMRIGVYEEPAEYLFGRVGAIAPAPEGAIYVYDAQLVSIRLYAPDGMFERAVGAQGQGPGEYMRLHGMHVLPNGSLAVLDNPHRVIVFGSDGTYSHDFRVQSNMFSSHGMFEIDRDGHFYVMALDREFERGDSELRRILLKISMQGEALGHVRLPPLRIDTYLFGVASPHAWSPLGALVVGNNETYAFTIGVGNPDSVHVARDFEPVALHPEERDEWQAYQDFLEEGDRKRGQSNPRSPIPSVKPAYLDLLAGRDGRIWVHRHVVAEKRQVPQQRRQQPWPVVSWHERPTYDVFESDGKFVGTVVLPEDTRLMAMRGSYVWLVEYTDEGERVVRFRLERAPPG